LYHYTFENYFNQTRDIWKLGIRSFEVVFVFTIFRQTRTTSVSADFYHVAATTDPRSILISRVDPNKSCLINVLIVAKSVGHVIIKNLIAIELTIKY